MYSFPNLEPVCCSITHSNCCFLTCVKVLQKASKMALYSSLFRSFTQFVVICTVNEAEEDFFFLEFSCFLYDPMDVVSLISGSSAFSKSNLYNWNFLVHILLKPSLKDFEHNLTSMGNECYCTVVRTFFGIVLIWDWNGN